MVCQPGQRDGDGSGLFKFESEKIGGVGAANEIVEFIATISLPNTNVGGYENTGWDLVANFVGCIIAAVMIGAGNKTGSRNNEWGSD